MKIDEVTGEKWDAILNLNLKSAVLCSQAVVASMMERRAGPSSTWFRSPGATAAGPARSLLGGQSRADRVHQIAARELGPHGIRVNAVSRG